MGEDRREGTDPDEWDDEDEGGPDDDGPRDPWFEEMTRQGVAEIREAQAAGRWPPTARDIEIYHRAKPCPAPPEAPARPAHRRASDAIWERARDEYLAGDAAEAVCARYGLGLSTLRQRAKDEGWRRQDQPDPEPVDLEAELEAGLPDYAVMARHALVRTNRALLGGRAAEAASWMRLHMRLLDLARVAGGEPSPPEPDPEPADSPPPQSATPKSPAPRPKKPVSEIDALATRMRVVGHLARAVNGLDMRDETSRRIVDVSMKALDAMERLSAPADPPKPPDLDGLDDLDGVFPPAGSGSAEPAARPVDGPP